MTVVFAGGRREQAKNDRRARVVDAAYNLLREVGLDELSMKALAGRAGVSLATLYNLFGSKQAVLTNVFDRDLELFEARVAALPSSDALQRIFDAVDVAADLYGSDPDFYRATAVRQPAGADDKVLRTAYREPRAAFWRRCLTDAADAGLLRPTTNPELLSVLIIQIFSGVIADWVGGDVSIEQLRLEIKFGLAATLSTFAPPHQASRLRDQLNDLSGQIAQLRTPPQTPLRVVGGR